MAWILENIGLKSWRYWRLNIRKMHKHWSLLRVTWEMTSSQWRFPTFEMPPRMKSCHTRWNPKLIQMGNIKVTDFTSCNLYQICDICFHMPYYKVACVYIFVHTHICTMKGILLFETGSQKIVKHFCSIFVSAKFKASLWWKFLGPMRWIGTITPPAWNHDDFTILAAMSKRRTRSAWPHVSPQLDLQGFFNVYRGSMEETQFKAVMSSPDQAEWMCRDLITSQENKRSFQAGNPPK